jgi:hypothetical protein
MTSRQSIRLFQTDSAIALPRAPIITFTTVVAAPTRLTSSSLAAARTVMVTPVATTQSTIPRATFLTFIDRSPSNVSALRPSGLFNRAHVDSWPETSATSVCVIEQTPQVRSGTISRCCGTPVRLPRDALRRHSRFPNIRCDAMQGYQDRSKYREVIGTQYTRERV